MGTHISLTLPLCITTPERGNESQKQHTSNQSNKQPSPIHRESGYDTFGNLNRVKDGPVETRYAYDLLNRLKHSEAINDGKITQEAFHFDPAGNILDSSQNQPNQSNQSNQNNKQNNPNKNGQGNRLSFQGDRHFTYDKRGNLIQEKRGRGGKLITRYQYNLNNQLTKIEKNGQTTEYTYDPLGRRIKKQDEFGTTRYLWAGDQLVQEERNNLKKTYIYEPESFKPLAMVQDGEVYHYHLDHLGTPQELSNQHGKIVWKARYTTYGNVAYKEVDEIENNIRFQGQYFDEESGLHYNRHRYYDPNIGQFTTQDPIGLLGGVNNYQYAPNPTGWIDPFGLSCKEEPITDPSRILPAPESLTPEMPGAPITSVILPAGYRFNQAVSPGQPSPGKFGTDDTITSVDYVRNELAVIPPFKEKISGVRQVEITRPVRVQRSVVGPQKHNGITYPGGGTQIDVLEYDPKKPFVKFVGEETPLE